MLHGPYGDSSCTKPKSLNVFRHVVVFHTRRMLSREIVQKLARDMLFNGHGRHVLLEGHLPFGKRPGFLPTYSVHNSRMIRWTSSDRKPPPLAGLLVICPSRRIPECGPP